MNVPLDGFIQLGNNPVLLMSFIFTIVVLLIASVSGIAITLKFSAVLRLVLDSLRPIIVFVVEISVPEYSHDFQPLQIVGFLIITSGVFIFNDILFGKILMLLYLFCPDTCIPFVPHTQTFVLYLSPIQNYFCYPEALYTRCVMLTKL